MLKENITGFGDVCTIACTKFLHAAGENLHFPALIAETLLGFLPGDSNGALQQVSNTFCFLCRHSQLE